MLGESLGNNLQNAEKPVSLMSLIAESDLSGTRLSTWHGWKVDKD